jgi:hypothetical protein
MSEWKGPEALNTSDDPLAFWNVVSEPGKPEDAVIGEAIYIESSTRRWISIVRDKWVDARGNTQIRFTDPRIGEKYEAPTLTIIVRNR